LCSTGTSCVVLQLHLCLVSSSPRKVGQFSFECCLCPRDQLQDPLPALCREAGLFSHPHSQSSCFSWSLLSAGGSSRRLVCHSTPSLSLYASPDLCWMDSSSSGWLASGPTAGLLWFSLEGFIRGKNKQIKKENKPKQQNNFKRISIVITRGSSLPSTSAGACLSRFQTSS
jgi:hypothetical protein